MIFIGTPARALFVAAGVWLIISGSSDLTATSAGNEYGSWADETSFAALGIRSNGSLKVGVGLGCLAGAAVGLSAKPSGSAAGFNSSPTQGGGSEKSDGTQEGDFQACSKMYVQSGGRKTPVKANSSITGSSLVLCDIYGKPLANFDKDEAGSWYCRGFYG